MILEILKTGNYQLIDVREPMELDVDGQIPNAINIPLGEIPDHLEQIKSYQTPVILFCRSGNRSGKAIEFLENEGLTNLHNGGGWASLKETIETL